MEIQPPITPQGFQTVSMIVKERKRSDLLLFLVLFMSMLSLVPLLVIAGIAIGFGYIFALLVVLILTAVVIRWPIVGFFVVLASALAIDQSPLDVVGGSPTLYVLYWPPSLQGLPDRPIGFFMLFILAILVLHGLLKREKMLRGGELWLPFLLFFLCVIWGIVHGLSSGGNLQILVEEVRSFWYLLLGYLLAYNLISKKQHVRLMVWLMILCAGIKALQGVSIYVFVIHGDLASNHQIMAHEESYFWISILLLIVLFSLHSMYRPQFFAALAILPFLLLSLVANNRRADFVALVVGLIVAWLCIFTVKKHARKSLLVILLVTTLLGGAYVAAFYNGTGGVSSPARALVSVFHPDPSDASSNLYRQIEDYDLQFTVKSNPMGLGFGRPFLQPILLPDLSSLDPVYNYIPHNTIYWVWMRLGPIGFLALWYLFGAMIVRGCIIVRQLKDTYLQLIAIYIVAMFVMEIIVAYADYQLSFYRNVIYIGILAGVLMRLPKIDVEVQKI
ncbi:MAG: O-antigen ligase family protein [Ktedonobacteraceae bacterium]